MESRETKALELAGPGATHLVVKLSYNKGGMNYFTSREEQRGLYLSVIPVTRENRGAYTTESFGAFSGNKQCVLEMSRFNQKKLDSFSVDPEVEQKLIDHVLAKNGLKLK